jgi:ABC-2 type transport system permease protein
MAFTKYAGFAAMGSEANELLERLPDLFKNAFNMSSSNITEIKGYYSVLFMYYTLITGIHAIMLGATIISKEARDKTADFLMVKPITRSSMITSKLIASFISILIINIVTGVTTIIVVDINNKGESITSSLIYSMIVILIIQCIFLSLGLLISAFAEKAKKATTMSTGIILIMYFLDIFRNISDKLDFVKYITPFSYFNINKVLNGNGFEVLYIVLSIIIILVSVILTYTNYQRKDIL